MRFTIVCTLAAGLTLAGMVSAAETGASENNKAHRTADGHPDLSGIWTYAIAIPFGGLKKEVDGQTEFSRVDPNVFSAHAPAKVAVPGALPSTPTPSYKPELQAKVKYLDQNESKVDPVFYCAQPGVPRVGPPRRIVQLQGEVIFLYEDAAGDPYRIIPTDGRPHRKDSNPSYYGDSVGHWEETSWWWMLQISSMKPGSAKKDISTRTRCT